MCFIKVHKFYKIKFILLFIHKIYLLKWWNKYLKKKKKKKKKKKNIK